MRSSDFTKDVMTILKGQASAKGYTQIELAKKLDVSLPTLKRWLSGKAVTLENLKKLTDTLGVSFAELATATNDKGRARFQYTLEQEEQFARNPELLAFFDYLVRGHSASNIQKKFSLSIAFIERCLSRLDKLGLIDWLPKNKASLKVVGEPEWRKNGPLTKKFKNQIRSDFLNSHGVNFERFALHDYLPEDKLKIERMLEDVLELSRQAGSRAAASKSMTEAGGLFVSFKKFRWDLDSYLLESYLRDR